MAARPNGRGTMDAVRSAHAAGAGASAHPDPRAHGAHLPGGVGTRVSQGRPEDSGNAQGPQVPPDAPRGTLLNPAAAWPFPPSSRDVQGPQVPLSTPAEDTQPSDVPPATKEEV